MTVTRKNGGREDLSKKTERTKQRRFSLRLKMNILIGASILITSLGLLTIAYNVHCTQINQIYLDQAERAARIGSVELNIDSLLCMIRSTETDEFLEVRERAVSANDQSIIKEWMKSRHGSYSPIDDSYTLFDDYAYLCEALLDVQDAFSLTQMYIMYEKDGKYGRDGEFYILVDLYDDLLSFGKHEPYIKELSDYDDSKRIPATVYHNGTDWLCTACDPIFDPVTGEVAALSCADIDMNAVVRKQQWFWYNSVILIVLLTAAAIAISMLLVEFTAVKPLCLLRHGAVRFTKEDADGSGADAYTMDDVMSLDIKNRDEIGELYHKIRDMQISIVKHTEEMTRITAEKEHIKTELDLAANIQLSALPTVTPDILSRGGFDLAVSMKPAKEVGGDFYDFFRLDDNRIVLVIADVSGKGIPAALFMMSAKDRINSRARGGGTPAEILQDVNSQLCENNQTKMFVTVWLGILDLKTGILTACNGGHEEPVLRSGNGGFDYIHDPHGIILGAFSDIQYTDYEVTMRPGDILFVFTDGIPEAIDSERHFYGSENLLRTLNSSGQSDPDSLISAVKSDLAVFTVNTEQFDDQTMLCLRYKGSDERTSE